MQLHIIGLGVSATAQLDKTALKALHSADQVIGSCRQLATVEHLLQNHQQQILLPKLKQLKLDLMAQQESATSIVVLASGDPLLYGIGRWFSRTFDSSTLAFYPAVSSIQAACHKLGRAFQDLKVLSLHGRPLVSIRRHLKRHQALIILTDKYSTPQALAQECIDNGFADSKLTVLELLGYEGEKISTYTALELVEDKQLIAQTFDPLHVTLIEPQGLANVLPEFPGIADHKFVTDQGEGKGMITKREIRLSILSLLQPAKADCIWDIGAGCGSVSIELSFWNPEAQVHGIEYHPNRLACLKQNQTKFGVTDNLHIVEGKASEVVGDLPKPNKVFIGGSGGELSHLLEQAWLALPIGGILVVSAVTEKTRQQVFSFYEARLLAQDSEFESLQISVSKGDLLAGQLMYRPSLPVVLSRFQKRQPIQDNTETTHDQ